MSRKLISDKFRLPFTNANVIKVKGFSESIKLIMKNLPRVYHCVITFYAKKIFRFRLCNDAVACPCKVQAQKTFI